MNARFVPPVASVTGVLLFSGFDVTESLKVDLYGDLPCGESGYVVESIYVHGDTAWNIVELFSGEKLDAMGEWMDHKDEMGSLPKLTAANALHKALGLF